MLQGDTSFLTAGLTKRLLPLMKTGSGSTTSKRTNELNAKNAKELKRLLDLTTATFKSIHKLFSTSPTSFGSNSTTKYCSAGKENCMAAWEEFSADIVIPSPPLTPAGLRVVLSALLKAASIFDPYAELYPVSLSKNGPLYSSKTNVKISRGGTRGTYTRKYMEPQALDVVNYQGKRTPDGIFIPKVPKSSPFKEIQALGNG